MNEFNLTCEALGLDKAELQSRVVDAMAEKALCLGPEGERVITAENLETEVKAFAKKAINERIDALAAEHITPNVERMIKESVLQKTNEWGEAKGKEFTFVEYLVSRADHYISEPVNYDGETKAEASQSYGSSWRGAQSRLIYLIDSKIKYSISLALEQAIKGIEKKIGAALEDTIKMQMAELSKKLSVSIERKR